MTSAQCLLSEDSEKYKELVVELAMFLLEQEKSRIPIRRPDLAKLVLGDNSRNFNNILKDSTFYLRQMFGYVVVVEEEKVKKYFLASKVSYDAEIHGNLRDSELSQMGVITVIAAIIFMSGNEISSDRFWQVMKKFQLEEHFEHQVFGPVRAMVDLWQKQQWFEFSQDVVSNPPTYKVTWGVRSQVVFSKVDLLQFVGEVMNEDLKVWEKAYEEVQQELEGNVAQVED